MPITFDDIVYHPRCPTSSCLAGAVDAQPSNQANTTAPDAALQNKLRQSPRERTADPRQTFYSRQCVDSGIIFKCNKHYLQVSAVLRLVITDMSTFRCHTCMYMSIYCPVPPNPFLSHLSIRNCRAGLKRTSIQHPAVQLHPECSTDHRHQYHHNYTHGRQLSGGRQRVHHHLSVAGANHRDDCDEDGAPAILLCRYGGEVHNTHAAQLAR